MFTALRTTALNVNFVWFLHVTWRASTEVHKNFAFHKTHSAVMTKAFERIANWNDALGLVRVELGCTVDR